MKKSTTHEIRLFWGKHPILHKAILTLSLPIIITIFFVHILRNVLLVAIDQTYEAYRAIKEVYTRKDIIK